MSHAFTVDCTQVLERANKSEYGLAAGIFSKDVDTINALSRCFICPSVPPLIVCAYTCLVCIFGKDLDMINALSRCTNSLHDCVLILLYYVQLYSAVHVHGF